jgi:anti-sigma B factor antagonist
MLDIQINRQDDVHVVRLVGEAVATDNEALVSRVSELCTGENARLAIDLSQLKAIDSSGLSALIQIATRARMTHGRVILAAPTPFVAGVFRVTRLDRWFDLCESVAVAQRQLKES